MTTTWKDYEQAHISVCGRCRDEGGMTRLCFPIVKKAYREFTQQQAKMEAGEKHMTFFRNKAYRSAQQWFGIMSYGFHSGDDDPSVEELSAQVNRCEKMLDDLRAALKFAQQTTKSESGGM